MAFSRWPIMPGPCKHEYSKALVTSPDTMEHIKQSWYKIQDYGLVPTGFKLYSRLKSEASPDDIGYMELCISNAGLLTMKKYCIKIITILNEIILNKLDCTVCAGNRLKRISQKPIFFALSNTSEVYRPVTLSIKWVLEDVIQDGFSAPAWEEFFASLQSILEEIGPCCCI